MFDAATQTRLSGLGWLGAAARLTKVFTSVTSPRQGRPCSCSLQYASGDMDSPTQAWPPQKKLALLSGGMVNDIKRLRMGIWGLQYLPLEPRLCYLRFVSEISMDDWDRTELRLVMSP